MKIRNSNVELARFIASILIMTLHIFTINIENRPCVNAYIYVEFFLIITGYYTAKHFDDKSYSNPIKESIVYTIRKFIPFLPYTISATILMYLLNYIPKLILSELNIRGFISVFFDDFIFDIMLIIESYSHPADDALWYISAMFIVFPLFAFIMQISNRYWIIFITGNCALFYYGVIGLGNIREYPNNFFRVIAGLFVGAFIYEIVYVFEDYIDKLNKIYLTFVEVIAFLLPIVIVFLNLGKNRFVLFCFTVCLIIMLPGFSYSSRLKGKVFTFLGKMSIPIYIYNMCIGMVVQKLSLKIPMDNRTKILLYYGGTILISIISLQLVEHWRWFQTIKNKSLVLKD